MNVSVKLLPKQLQFLTSPKRFVLYSGGRGSGKSRSLAYAAFRDACNEFNEVLVVRKALTDLKSSTLMSLIGGEDPVIPVEAMEYHNKTEGIIKIKGGGIIRYRGLDRSTSVRSMNNGLICIDEVIEFSEREYEELLYSLRNKAGSLKVYMATNPGLPSPENFLYRKFFIEKNDDHEVITTSSYDNHHLPSQFFDMFKHMNEDRKKQMVDGLWVALDNVVFPEFSRQKHTKCLEKDGFEEYILGIDWGQSHPVALLLCGVYHNKIHVLKEFVQKDILIDKLRAIIKETWNKYSNLTIIYDPSAKVIANDLANIGITLKKANNDVAVGINRIHNRLGNGDLVIDESCENLIREFENYCYKEGTEIPKKIGDDCLDVIRYVCNELDDATGTFIYPQVFESKEVERPEDEEELWVSNDRYTEAN